MVTLDKVQDILFVSFGALLGANIRFVIYEKLQKKKLRSYLVILIINTLASFGLGFFLALLPHLSSFDFSYKVALFFSIGCLGSLSTFSTFVYDLFELVKNHKFFIAIKLFIFSTALGILALALGSLLGNN